MARLAPSAMAATSGSAGFLSSRAAAFLSPLAALAITVVAGAVLFAALGKPPARALAMFFVEPLRDGRALAELAIKATPLALIALGLAIAFRANVWNIGAEGQFIVGAIAATGVVLLARPSAGPLDRRRARRRGRPRRHGVGGAGRAGCAIASRPTRSWSA